MLGRPRGTPAFLMAAIALVLVAIGAGLYVLGTPGTARAERLDERRILDLHQCATAINEHWRNSGRLPPVSICQLVDPQTARPYEYVGQSGTTYQLCATFDAASPGQQGPRWRHDAGRTCFTLDAVDLLVQPPDRPSGAEPH